MCHVFLVGPPKNRFRPIFWFSFKAHKQKGANSRKHTRWCRSGLRACCPSLFLGRDLTAWLGRHQKAITSICGTKGFGPKIWPSVQKGTQASGPACTKPHLLSGWPKIKSKPNYRFTTKMVFPKRLKFMNSGSEQYIYFLRQGTW